MNRYWVQDYNENSEDSHEIIHADVFEIDRSGIACFYEQESSCDRPELIMSLPADKYKIIKMPDEE